MVYFDYLYKVLKKSDPASKTEKVDSIMAYFDYPEYMKQSKLAEKATDGLVQHIAQAVFYVK